MAKVYFGAFEIQDHAKDYKLALSRLQHCGDGNEPLEFKFENGKSAICFFQGTRIAPSNEMYRNTPKEYQVTDIVLADFKTKEKAMCAFTSIKSFSQL